MNSENRVCLYYSMRREALDQGCPEESVTDHLERIILETTGAVDSLPDFLRDRTRPWISRRLLCMVADYHGADPPLFPEFLADEWEEDGGPFGSGEPEKLHAWGDDWLGQHLRHHYRQMSLLKGHLHAVRETSENHKHLRVLTGPSMQAVMRSLRWLADHAMERGRK
jgi:hypothetical protein